MSNTIVLENVEAIVNGWTLPTPETSRLTETHIIAPLPSPSLSC